MWLGHQVGCVGPHSHLLVLSKGNMTAFPDSGEWIMLLSVAGGLWSAEEAIRVRSMGCSHFCSAESSAGVADGEYQVWNSSLIAVKALKT